LTDSETDQMARRLLIRTAFFAPGEVVPRELLRTSCGEGTQARFFADGLKRLLALGLVQENLRGDVRMHRLVGCYVLNTLEDEGALQQVEQALIDQAYEANMSGFPARMRRCWRTCSS